MVLQPRNVRAIAVLAATAAFGSLAIGQESAPGAAPGATAPIAPDEIIVVGRIDELRKRLRLAEDAFYARFNEINSDDRFDIHCYSQPNYASHIESRVCSSNSWREQDANFAQSSLAELRGEMGPVPQQFPAEQQRVQDLLGKEVARLVAADPTLAQDLIELASANDALGKEYSHAAAEALAQEVPAGDNGLPFDAKHVFAVRMGRATWLHPLTEPIFTIADVHGKIRKLDLRCEGHRTQLAYQPDVDWTVPASWRECTLSVVAKSDTTFALYEFRRAARDD